MGHIIILPEYRQQNPVPFHNAILADNPTVYFRMDDAAAPLTDEMSCCNNMLAYGTPSFQQPGKFGFAITTAVNAGVGDYFTSVPPPGTGGCCGAGSPDFINTYEAIIRRNGAPSGGDEYFAGNYENIAIGVQQSTGYLQVLFERSTAGGPYQTITSTLNVCDNQWHHVAVTVNFLNWQLYVDGVNQAPAAGLNWPNTGFNGACTLLFARSTKGGAPAPVEAEVFVGEMSMYAWWRGASLSAGQIGVHYAAYQLI